MEVSCADPEGISYQWYINQKHYYDDGDDYYWSSAPIENATDSAYTVESVTEYTEYYCRVTDKYGNQEDVWYYIRVENHLTVEVDGDWEKTVEPNDDVTLRVNASSDDETIFYRWMVYDRGTPPLLRTQDLRYRPRRWRT